MTAGSHRAFRYRLAHPDETMDGGGLEIDALGRFGTTSGAASIRQAILLLLSTRRGERVGRPTYGCDLHRLAFAPNDDTTAGLAIHMVREALEEWEPRIEVVRLDIVDFDDPGVLPIVLDYRLVDSGAAESLVVPLSLETGDVT